MNIPHPNFIKVLLVAMMYGVFTPLDGQVPMESIDQINFAPRSASGPFGGVKGCLVYRGKPVENVVVLCTDQFNKPHYSITGPTGVFALGGLRPGKVQFRINLSIGDVFWPCTWDLRILENAWAVLSPIEIDYTIPSVVYSYACSEPNPRYELASGHGSIYTGEEIQRLPLK